MSRKTDRMGKRLGRAGEPAIDRAGKLRAGSAKKRSEAILGLGRPEYWSPEEREAFAAACALPMDSSVRETVWVDGCRGVCEAFVKALSMAPPKAAEKLWKANGLGFKGDQARQFVEAGGLKAEAPESWAPELRRAVFSALADSMPERELWPYLRAALDWESADEEGPAQWGLARWVAGAGLLAAGMAQRMEPKAESSGALGELARSVLARWGDEMSERESQGWAGLARAAPPMTGGQRANAQHRLIKAAGLPAERAEAACRALDRAGMLREIDARYLSASATKKKGERLDPLIWAEAERPGEGVHPAWAQWEAGQSAASAEAGFEALLGIKDWPGSRAPPWRALRAIMGPQSLNWEAGVARWLGEMEARGEPLTKEDLLSEPESGAPSLPAELAFSQDAALFERLSRALARAGLSEESWPNAAGEPKSVAELTESWGEGRSIWERSRMEGDGSMARQAPEAGRRAGPRL